MVGGGGRGGREGGAGRDWCLAPVDSFSGPLWMLRATLFPAGDVTAAMGLGVDTRGPEESNSLPTDEPISCVKSHFITRCLGAHSETCRK